MDGSVLIHVVSPLNLKEMNKRAIKFKKKYLFHSHPSPNQKLVWPLLQLLTSLVKHLFWGKGFLKPTCKSADVIYMSSISGGWVSPEASNICVNRDVRKALGPLCARVFVSVLWLFEDKDMVFNVEVRVEYNFFFSFSLHSTCLTTYFRFAPSAAAGQHVGLHQYVKLEMMRDWSGIIADEDLHDFDVPGPFPHY